MFNSWFQMPIIDNLSAGDGSVVLGKTRWKITESFTSVLENYGKI
jgi:hypothetical protein